MEWVSITEAARRLSSEGDALDRSTLSRYLTKHADALTLRRDGQSNLVDIDALREHRRTDVRLAGRMARLAESPAAPLPGRAVVRGSEGTQAEAAARDMRARAEMREMDLEVRRRELTPTGEVDEAGRAAVGMMVAAFDRAVETAALDFSLRYGWEERAARSALKQFARIGVDAFHRAVLGSLDQMRRRDEAATLAGEAGDDGAGDGMDPGGDRPGLQ